MIGNFRIRMLIVIIILAGLIFCLRTDQHIEVIMPVMQYVMKESGLEEKALQLIGNYADDRYSVVLPVINTNIGPQIPCQFKSVQKSYGWLLDPDTQKTEFHPGILLEVQDQSVIRPIMAGHVVEVGQDNKSSTITIKHNEDLYSYYSGLSQVTVEVNATVQWNTSIGRSGNTLYLELRNKEGPFDPQTLLKSP